MKKILFILLMLVIPTSLFAGISQFGVIQSFSGGTAIQNGTTVDIPALLENINGMWFLDNYLINFGLTTPAVPTENSFVLGSLSAGYQIGTNSAVPRIYFMLGGANKWFENESHGAFIGEGGLTFPYYPGVFLAGIQYEYTPYSKVSEIKAKIGVALRWGGTAPVPASKIDMAAGGETIRGFFPVR